MGVVVHKRKTRPRNKHEREAYKRTISKAVRGQYRRYLVCYEEHGYRRNFKDLCRFVQKGPKNTKGTLRGVMNAVKWKRRYSGKRYFSNEEQEKLDILIAARILESKEKKSRGGVDLPKLRKFLAWLETKVKLDPVWLIYWKICWSGGLRTSQMAKLRRSNFKPNRHGELEIMLERQHDPRGVMKQKETEKHVVVDLFREEIEEHLTSLREHELVCEHWRAWKANKLIQEAALTLKWDKRLKWDGAHCMKHGVAIYLAGRAGDFGRARRTTAHQGEVVRHYSKLEKERLRRDRHRRRRRRRAKRELERAHSKKKKKKHH